MVQHGILICKDQVNLHNTVIVDLWNDNRCFGMRQASSGVGCGAQQIKYKDDLLSDRPASYRTPSTLPIKLLEMLLILI